MPFQDFASTKHAQLEVKSRVGMCGSYRPQYSTGQLESTALLASRFLPRASVLGRADKAAGSTADLETDWQVHFYR